MTVMADNCPDVDIDAVDHDQRRIEGCANLNASELLVSEPGLRDVLDRVRGRNLQSFTDFSAAIQVADMAFLSVNTPTKYFDILSSPEFMLEGAAIDALDDPDPIRVGGECELGIDAFVGVYGNWVHPNRIITTNLWLADLAKLTANAFLAQCIASINAIANLCEATGMDLLDSIYTADHCRLKYVANCWRSVVDLNGCSQQWIFLLIVESLFASPGAVLDLADWTQYRFLNRTDLAARMLRPAWIFDACRSTNQAKAEAQGFDAWPIGYGGML
jgi:hypothetical protein